MKLVIIISLFISIYAKMNNDETKFCDSLDCNRDGGTNSSVCGLRVEGTRYKMKIFESECELQKYNCLVPENLAYRIINIKYCDQTLNTVPESQAKDLGQSDCDMIPCPNSFSGEICGIRKESTGYAVAQFGDECEMLKHNCRRKVQFTKTDDYLCRATDNKPDLIEDKSLPKSLIVVKNLGLSLRNINESIDNFFAATHFTNLPVTEMSDDDFMNTNTRRMLIRVFGPQKVFKPFINIPRNFSLDEDHQPTLASCYHKCPEKCPDNYNPVCGLPGVIAREPSLMFQNHCFMDKAQCKMWRENKSPTAKTSAYMETSFLFCLGDELNSLYRFLPIIRTLQHMGRIRKRGKYNYKVRNLRFFNNFMQKEPRIMG